jgi:glyceraldehyde 3-phosphate dehydrogenase
VDLVAIFKAKVTKESVNQAFKEASEGALKGILALGYSAEQLVSSDNMRTSVSGTVDSLETKVNANLVKTLAWYDNEWGYPCKLRDLVESIAK